MRAVLQRVKRGSVTVNGRVVGAVGAGLLVYAGVQKGDTEADAEYIASKIAGLRIFEDDGGKMNLSAGEAGGAVLLVSQFTLLADARKGRRPSFDGAAPPEEAVRLYDILTAKLKATGLSVATGEFRARMEVESVNDGPVTILIDSRRLL